MPQIQGRDLSRESRNMVFYKRGGPVRIYHLLFFNSDLKSSADKVFRRLEYIILKISSCAPYHNVSHFLQDPCQPNLKQMILPPTFQNKTEPPSSKLSWPLSIPSISPFVQSHYKKKPIEPCSKLTLPLDLLIITSCPIFSLSSIFTFFLEMVFLG